MTANHDHSDHGQKLEALAERYVLVTEAMSEGVYDWDILSGRLEISARLCDITGLAATKITADDWNSRIHTEDFAAYRDAIVRHLKGDTYRLNCEYRIRRATGDYIWIADTGRCLREDSGKAVRLIGAIRDVTARKLSESKFKGAQRDAETAREHLLDAIESISEGLVLFDAEDRVVLCNSNFRRYFAATVGEEIADMIQPGAVFWDFLREAHSRGMLPLVDQKGGIEAYIEMRKEMRQNPKGPVEQLLSDGRWLQINEHKTTNGGIASVYTDITDLKRREVELANKTEELEVVSSKLSKYLAPQVHSLIFSGGAAVDVAAKRKKLTVFFSDIVGFTTLVDALESEELTNLLNEYLTEMSAIAIEHGGTVDKFIGDAVMAFFGDPVSRGTEEDAKACVAMAKAMQARLSELSRRWRDKGLDERFELRIGIATGFCTVGNFGSEDRLDYTAVGHAVNVASRLQTQAEKGGILLDNETYHLVKQEVGPAEEVHLSVKGIAKPVRAFSIKPCGDSKLGMIGIHAPGVQVSIEVDALSEEDRVATAKVLKSALDRLEEES